MKIPFNIEEPFPLLAWDSYTYSEAKEHSVLVDNWLGFEYPLIEEQIRRQGPDERGGGQTWSHLDPQAFQTPYVEIRSLLDILSPTDNEFWIDLGCGYGRWAFVIGRHYPKLRFVGYEVNSLRVREANRVLRSENFSYENVEIIQQDLSNFNFSPPLAGTYFMYDFGHSGDISKTLEDLRKIAREQPIQVVARGRGVRQIIHQFHPWLGAVNPARHYPQFSIYSS